MKYRVRIPRRAEADITFVAHYLARDAPASAERVLDGIFDPIEDLDQSPEKHARARDERHCLAANCMSGALRLKRSFGLDALGCSTCGHRMTLIATSKDPQIVSKLLTHLGLPIRASPVSPPWRPAVPTAKTQDGCEPASYQWMQEQIEGLEPSPPPSSSRRSTRAMLRWPRWPA